MSVSRVRPSCCCAKRIRILCKLLERESCAKNEGKSAAKFNPLQPVTSMHRFLLNSVECMIFGFLQSSKPSRCVPTVSRPSSFSEAGVYFGLVAVTGNHAPGCHGRELRHRDWQRSGRRIGSGLGLTRTRPSMDGHRPGPGPTANKKNLKAGYWYLRWAPRRHLPRRTGPGSRFCGPALATVT